jgi:hypothetical protein
VVLLPKFLWQQVVVVAELLVEEAAAVAFATTDLIQSQLVLMM